jgi:hypothetical protein
MQSIPSDGSTAEYYQLPENATQLQDLISFRNMNAQDGEIFRAIYRKGLCPHSSELREARKVLFYAEAEVKRLSQRDIGVPPANPHSQLQTSQMNPDQPPPLFCALYITQRDGDAFAKLCCVHRLATGETYQEARYSLLRDYNLDEGRLDPRNFFTVPCWDAKQLTNTQEILYVE